jgi:hypothetical protein
MSHINVFDGASKEPHAPRSRETRRAGIRSTHRQSGAEPASDLIQELRLRRWARKHYVPPADRDDASWHDIALDEMRRKDAEIEAAAQNSAPPHRYVPLAPMPVHSIHDAHIPTSTPQPR